MALSKGTGYTNLQKYIAANQGNRIGNVINTGINNTVSGGQKELENQRNTFQTGIGAEQNRLNNVFAGGKNTLNTLNTNAKAIGDNEVGQFKNALNAQYAGPTGLKNENELNRKVTNINDVSNLAGSRAGRGQLLQTFINSPNYTKNKEELDSVLLGNNVDTQLRKARQSGQQLAGNINSTVQGAKGQVGVTQASLNPRIDELRGGAQTAGKSLVDSLNTRATEKQNEADAFRANLEKRDLNALNNYVNPSDLIKNQYNTLKQYGAGDEYWSNLVNPTYAQNINPAGVATEEDRAKASALSRLLTDPTYNAYTTGDAYTAPSVALNTGKANEVALNKYNQVTGQMTLPELARYNPEVGQIITDWQTGINNYVDNSPALKTFDALGPEAKAEARNQMLSQLRTYMPENNTLSSAITLGQNPTGSGYNPAQITSYPKLQELLKKLQGQFGVGTL